MIIGDKEVFISENFRLFTVHLNKNGKINRRFGEIRTCEVCGKSVFIRNDSKYNKPFCSNACRSKFYKEIPIKSFIVGEYTIYMSESGRLFKIRPTSRDRVYGKIIKCIACGADTFVELHDIKDTGNFCSLHCANSGKFNNHWEGGVTPTHKVIRNCAKYINQRNECFVRDNYTCQMCGKRGGVLNAHHLKHFAEIWKENDIQTIDDAFRCKELWDLDNLLTLCYECHKDIHRSNK